MMMTTKKDNSIPKIIAAPSCVIDRTVLNNTTLPFLKDIGLSFFAGLCGRNRGVFVTNPTDYGTWGCTSMPPELAVLANITDPTITIPDANAIKELYLAGNISSDDTIQLLNYFVQSVYSTTADTDHDTYACELGGLTTLINCPTTTTTTVPSSTTTTTTLPTTTTTITTKVRSVTMLGVFIPSSVVGTNDVSWEKRKNWYTQDDFQQMETLGLNTIQIPFPLSSFVSSTGSEHPHVTYLTSLFDNIGTLKFLLVLEVDDTTLKLTNSSNSSSSTIKDGITAAIQYIQFHTNSFIGIQIPSKQYLPFARSVAAGGSNLNIFVPITEGDLPTLVLLENSSHPATTTTTFASLTLDHSTTLQDVASSTSLDDRRKLFYQESKACIYRSPLEFSQCYKNIPIYISNGFDISIDNCVARDSGDNKSFIDYGQCDRFNETIGSAWWYQHRKSFLERQLFSYEKGLGWSYTSWKLYNTTTTTTTASTTSDDGFGIFNTPAKLIALQDIVAAKLFPTSLVDDNVTLACLNPPRNDFMMGDTTYSPTPGPPPDCGYGWWNDTIQGCTYWIPPPIAPPTPNPTPEPQYITIIQTQQLYPSFHDYIIAGGVGALLMIVIGSIVLCFYNKCCNRPRNNGYTTIE